MLAKATGEMMIVMTVIFMTLNDDAGDKEMLLRMMMTTMLGLTNKDYEDLDYRGGRRSLRKTLVLKTAMIMMMISIRTTFFVICLPFVSISSLQQGR